MASDQELKDYRGKADQLLGLAAQTSNMAERGRLIDEATAWHLKALNAEGASEPPMPDLDLPEDEQAPRRPV